MVYPNRVIENLNWTDNPPGIGILLALGEGDGMYVYNTAPDNLLHLGMPSEVVNCELSVRTDAGFTQLVVNFYRASTLIGTFGLFVTDNWTTHTLTVDRWDSVVLIADFAGIVGVDFLRAEPYGGAPTKRTLTGVGI